MKMYFALIQVNRGPHSHLLYYVFFMKKQITSSKPKLITNVKKHNNLKENLKRQVRRAVCYTHAGQPSFITFDPQVPHLSFYEHLKIQLLKTFPNSQFFSFSGILVIWKSTRWAAAALQQF